MYHQMLSDDYKYTVMVKLYYPDLAIDDDGNQGFWTMIYNEVCTRGNMLFTSFNNESFFYKTNKYPHTQVQRKSTFTQNRNSAI